jgi:hypothetical protein
VRALAVEHRNVIGTYSKSRPILMDNCSICSRISRISQITFFGSCELNVEIGTRELEAGTLTTVTFGTIMRHVQICRITTILRSAQISRLTKWE